MEQLRYCDEVIRAFEKVIHQPRRETKGELFTGVDIGTAFIVMAVVDEKGDPIAGAYKFADVVRDGMVVDYIGAVDIVKELKQKIEESIGRELLYAAAAIPPGTETVDSGAVRNVVESSGFILTALPDEPTAANKLLGMENGVVVDIGGGTTGVSVLQDGKVVHVFDEPSGGTHFSLVLAGSRKISFSEAELLKRDENNHSCIFPTLIPVIDKISGIITKGIQSFEVETMILVGGQACLKGMEERVEKNTGIRTLKPKNPMFVTPLGIALSCTDKELVR